MNEKNKDVENRIAELGKERPNYKYISEVGFYWDVDKDGQFIEYCRLEVKTHGNI